MTNTNCLEGMRCPHCGSTDRFEIVGTARFVVTDDGTDSFENPDWGSDDNCYCPECQHSGVVKDFKGGDVPVLKAFDVDMCRISYGHYTIRVWAMDEKNAEEAAHEVAGNFLYSEKTSEYEANDVREVKKCMHTT